ncbi:type II toxin-antitoxin system PemK/MazF family toxin [Williamwhitmania taraxaci]|uniref:type II toxin-antitoxin system PemK/MazF family toxin n=1 Tax=Williamwhitmania taraxaci TaxID=1640674 RepID=UPI000B87728C|nr:type II toxin-antitoxin system PemK/MazF family toxin [Williamwhitmania taraxaci]
MVQLMPNAQNGLSKESVADCFQVRSLSQERLIKKLGTVDKNTMEDIKDALKKVFSM